MEVGIVPLNLPGKDVAAPLPLLRKHSYLFVHLGSLKLKGLLPLEQLFGLVQLPPRLVRLVRLAQALIVRQVLVCHDFDGGCVTTGQVKLDLGPVHLILRPFVYVTH
jgi:hypothetical protein